MQLLPIRVPAQEFSTGLWVGDTQAMPLEVVRRNVRCLHAEKVSDLVELVICYYHPL